MPILKTEGTAKYANYAKHGSFSCRWRISRLKRFVGRGFGSQTAICTIFILDYAIKFNQLAVGFDGRVLAWLAPSIREREQKGKRVDADDTGG
jgi:hypothetical protein